MNFEDDDAAKVRNWIKYLKSELTCKETSSKITRDDTSIGNHVTKIHDPKDDQIVKKKLARKKTQKNKHEDKNCTFEITHLAFLHQAQDKHVHKNFMTTQRYSTFEITHLPTFHVTVSMARS